MASLTTQKWLEIVRFELVFQLRRKSTWFFFSLFLFPLVGVTSDLLLDANREIPFNAPLLLAENSAFMGLVAMLVLAPVAGDAATRDLHTRLAPLMHAAPIGRVAYVAGRFTGALTMAALLVAAIPLVYLLVPVLYAAPVPELVGSPNPAAFLETYCLLVLPNAFVATALMFALAMLVRHPAGSYAAVPLVFAGGQGVYGIVGEVLGRWELAGVLDSTGIVALDVMGRTWSPVEWNERLIASGGALLLNRVLWISIGLAVIAIPCRRFDFGANAGAVRWWRRWFASSAGPGTADALSADALSTAGAAAVDDPPVAVPPAPRDFGAAGRARQTLAIALDSLRELGTGWRLLAVPFVAATVLISLESLETMGGGTRVLPTTGVVLAPSVDLPPPVVLAIILFPILLAGEIIWRERDANLQGLADAAPVPNGVRFAGKLLGLWSVFVALFAALMLAGVLTQALSGWYAFEPATYLRLLGLELADALVFALFALSVHVLVNHKHVGHLLVILLIFGPRILAETLGIEHPLLIVGYEPFWRYSPISGFDPYLAPLLWFDLYWAAWTLLVALVAGSFWVRGVELSVGERLRVARRRFAGWTTRTTAAAAALVALAGGFVFFNTNVLNAYTTADQSLWRRADYERTYGTHRGTPQPRITATELDVEIYPERRRADVRGTHRLVNETAQPIDTIHVAVSSEVETGEIDFGRPARATVLDDALGHRIYVLEEPLRSGETLSMAWQLQHAPSGFSARGASTAVVGNGSFIVMSGWVPLIGYQPRRELAAAGDRRAHNLPARPAVPPLDDLEAGRDPGNARVYLDATVGTAADQTAVAVGELQRTWEQDGRRYFRYVTAAPIGIEYAIFSADYAVREARSGDVALEVVHHPEHDYNVERMMRGMQASLEQFTLRFGPYPYKVLRMVEYPAAGGSLHAAAATIWYQELFSLFDPERERRRIDMPFAVTAHEVAHQFQPVSASVEGRALLSESFAWYAALGVIEDEYGAEHLRRFLGFMRESYRSPRARADVPLVRASDSFLAYRKGPLAMYALREYLGQDDVDLAWRRLIARHASREPPFATSLDLARELREVTPDSLQYLLGDLLERNTFWELETTGASARRTDRGEWQVTIDVVARKVAVDTEGIETDLPMDDLVEIGVFAATQPGEEPGGPLHLEMHRVRTGPQTITITVGDRPARAGIDPRLLLIDVQPADNVVDVTDQTPPTR